MKRFDLGDKIRADLPDETDPDPNYELYHGRLGEIVDVIHDDGKATQDSRDSTLCRVEFENEEVADFRWRDLRPR